MYLSTIYRGGQHLIQYVVLPLEYVERAGKEQRAELASAQSGCVAACVRDCHITPYLRCAAVPMCAH
jgi:hypothetical protein